MGDQAAYMETQSTNAKETLKVPMLGSIQPKGDDVDSKSFVTVSSLLQNDVKRCEWLCNAEGGKGVSGLTISKNNIKTLSSQIIKMEIM